jgi:signal transduction histidine kinase
VIDVARWKRRAGDQPAWQRDRERHALDIHDNIVQGLAEAQMALDVGRPQQARQAVERTLAQARRIVTELMGEPAPGDLRRTTSADSLPER